ncbi:MAG: hypothetical protein IKJ19_03360 [Clostridia bacterium]|nr:hypothetical protein [Clostridia bacterium]
MSKYKVVFNGYEEDETFDSYEDAEDYALYLQSCSRTGAQTLHWSNPGDYDYDEKSYKPPKYRIKEID